VRTDEPRPLPECALCKTPTQRRSYRANGGMCTECRKVYDEAHGEQQQIPVVTSAPTPQATDLTNVVVLATRRKPKGV
jgi:recombinational DNA repair protein (RecF pathway)